MAVRIPSVVLALPAMTSALCAQPLPATSVWLTSMDGGASWQGGDREVTPGVTSILVRTMLSWDASGIPDTPPIWFRNARFDAVVVTQGTTGLNDTAQNFRVLDGNLFRPVSYLDAERQGNNLKIDPINDTQPPGQLLGVPPNQVPFGLPEPSASTANPILAFQYELLLDGTPGRRDITAMWIPRSGGGPMFQIVTSTNEEGYWATSVTLVPASVTVVPTAGPGLTLVCLSLTCMARRRRF